ncbi:MAG: tetratricopeptide repeat protein [Verrucomicrobiota bacterium]
MSVIAAYASRISSAGAGVGSKSRLTRHRPAPFIHFFLALAFVLSPASWKCLAAESSAQPLVTSQIEATNFQELLDAYLQLREQLQATQLTVEQNRQEAKEAAAQNAEALSKGLQSMHEAFSVERARELEAMQSSSQAMQRSNKVILIVVGTFAAMGFLTMLIMTYFQWRTSSSLAGISAALPPALGLGPASAVPALGPGDSGLVQGGPVEQSNRRLLAAIQQLKKRIHGLGQAARVELKSSEGTGCSGGNGESAAPSNRDSEARSAELAGTKDPARIAELLSQARSLLDVDNAEAALACFDKVLALEPDHSEALVKKGAALERLHRLNEAIECYDRAIAVDGTMTSAYLHKGGLCNRLERFKEALECYEKALRTHDKWGG